MDSTESTATTQEGTVLSRAWEATRNGAIAGGVVGMTTMRLKAMFLGAVFGALVAGGASLYNSARAYYAAKPEPPAAAP